LKLRIKLLPIPEMGLEQLGLMPEILG